MAQVHAVGVREIAEYACASGSIAAGATMARRLREGREGHAALQAQLPDNWQAEVPVEMQAELEGMQLLVQGRADALSWSGDTVCVAEIKTTRGDPYHVCQDDYPVHWAQAEIYAHMFCTRSGCRQAEVLLIYTGVQGGSQRFKRRFSAAELQERFLGYARPYALWLKEEEKWKHDSEPTLQTLKFPFADYREGQKEMASCVFQALCRQSRALIEAPTGIGKTAAALYGALKALGKGKITSVFYLTARTTGRRAAENALGLMRSSGLKLRSVTITAKEKVCLRQKADCAMCVYGDGYYDRRRGALRRAMGQEVFGPEEIETLAREFEICPFELSLDLSEIADVVICDYNYVFDPRVRLKRHFERKSCAGILVDEAHNLPDRAREMYSAALSGSRVHELKLRIAAIFGEKDPLHRSMEKLEAALTLKDAEYDARREPPQTLVQAAADFVDQAERLRVSDEDTVELTLECGWFARVAKRFDEQSYRALIRPEGEGEFIEVKLWCFAPEKYLDKSFSRVGGAALFSATLAPIDFYARMLAVPDKKRRLVLESPFPKENLFVGRIPVRVRYRDRSETMEQVTRVIHAMTEAKTGNYIACFPSHAYLAQAYKYYCARYPEAEAICQEMRMGEEKRRRFIACFRSGRERSMVAFIVLGGVFAEGVDLPDDLLSGAAIISTGIPQVNPESELLREMYDDGFEGGTDAAYTYPGFRRVLQAAGRVIRTETDRGVVLLLDERYAAEKYLELMPSHWQVRKIGSMSALNRQLQAFWKG